MDGHIPCTILYHVPSDDGNPHWPSHWRFRLLSVAATLWPTGGAAYSCRWSMVSGFDRSIELVCLQKGLPPNSVVYYQFTGLLHFQTHPNHFVLYRSYQQLPPQEYCMDQRWSTPLTTLFEGLKWPGHWDGRWREVATRDGSVFEITHILKCSKFGDLAIWRFSMGIPQ